MAFVLYGIGFMLRETGQALDRVGCRLQLKYPFREEIWRHRSVMNLMFKKPELGPEAFVAPTAAVIGNVQLGKKSSVWYGCVLRGDDASITVGEQSNIQDGSVIRTVRASLEAEPHDTIIGKNVTVGHRVSLAGVTIEDNSLIGMDAILQEGVKVEKGAMVAAGSVVPPGTTIPTGQLWGGNPARFLRQLKPEEAAFMRPSAEKYAALAAEHMKETNKPILPA